MLDELMAIDRTLRRIEKEGYFLTPHERQKQMDLPEEDRIDYISKVKQTSKAIQAIHRQFETVSSALSSEDIVYAYRHGCNLLRKFLAYGIYEKFTDDYIPLVGLAIEEDHEVAYRLLAGQADSSEAQDEFVEKILDSRWRMNIEAGLGIVRQYRLSQFAGKVEALVK